MPEDDAAMLVRAKGEPWRQPDQMGYVNEADLQAMLAAQPTLIPGVGPQATAVRDFTPKFPSHLSRSSRARSRSRWRLKALADPVRVRLFSLILTAEGGEACNCDMAGVVGLSDATVSHHLKALREAGPIVGERRGTWVYHSLVREALGALARVLDPACS